MPSKRELEAAETLASGTADATVPPSRGDLPLARAITEPGESGRIAVESRRFPVENWDHYEILSELGKGGMGAVYKARDKRLNRVVALKFILGAHPNLIMRFLQEARAQARIDHPNVCRVYEVGEVAGRAYIAMQFVAGEQLGRAAAQLSLDEKVAVMRDVAAAIHEAHKLGIVHRDLKPANILVERGEDGRWFPVVMDFGLAREATVEAGLTETGALLGTPAYMSPEQARGEQRAVDRRSDVYSLGATLYELITGRPPFSPTSVAAALEQIMTSYPAAPRSLDATLPLDLETIALKCLAKEPERRYASARALADDLGRYLDGEPILGRRPSLWYRLMLRARRNRALVALSLSSLAVIAMLAGLGARAALVSRRERARAAERARLAEALGRDAKEIEWLLRVAYQLPLHDTTPERELIRARMQRIAATRHDLGALGDATIHGALGRGHLALHEWQKAADELARAADAPGLHAARGRALGELYHRALADARRSGDPAWLDRRKHELERQYLEPALAELQKSRAEGESAEATLALEALVALYQRDYALAESRALAAAKQAPWLFESRQVAADAVYQAAVEKFDHGQYDDARKGLTRATALYDDAASVARSDASLHEAAAAAWKALGDIDGRQGRSPKDALEHALGAVDSALVADPHRARAYTTRSFALLRWYQTPALASNDRQPLLEKIAAAAARAVELEPRDAGAWEALGGAHLYRGMFEMVHGRDPVPWWNQATEAISKALAIEPNFPWANNDLGLVHRWLGTRLATVGGDPMPELQLGLKSYERALTFDPQYLIALNNIIDVQVAIAEWRAERGVDPGDAVAGARQAMKRALAIDPNYSVVYDNMARAELSRADYLLQAGRDPHEPLTAAHKDAEDSLKVSPGSPLPLFQLLLAARIEATYDRSFGRDPSRAIKAGRDALSKFLKITTDCVECFTESALLYFAEAGATDQPLLEKALAEARRAIARNDADAGSKIVAAEACLRLATARHNEGAGPLFRQGMEYANAAVSLNANEAEAYVVRAALLVAEAHGMKSGAGLERARVDAARAFAINPLLQREWGEKLREVLPK
jgi:serine/threonine-protein kinase